MDQEDEQILNFLNAPSSPESATEDAALNILSITDTALRALHDGNRAQIPTNEIDTRSQNGSGSESRPRSPPSSTASEILIRNTNVDAPIRREVDAVRSPDQDEDNDSVISDLRSDSVLSDSIDTSFRGAHVRKVKIGTNRLREIDSPLEAREAQSPFGGRAPTPPTKDDAPEPRAAPSLPRPRLAPVERKKAPSPPTREGPSPPVRDNPRLQQGRPARTSQGVVSDAGKMNLSEPSVVCYDVDTVPTKLGAEMATRHAESTLSLQSVASSASARSVTMDASVYPSSRLDDVSSPEILTVPENVVEVDGLSRGQFSSTSTLDDDASVEMATWWPGKPVGGRLVQGTRVQAPGLSAMDDTSMSRDTVMMTSQGEISVSQYDCSGKEQVVRDVLKRRQDQSSRPMKRFVQPRIIQSQASSKYDANNNANNNSTNDNRSEAGRIDLTTGTQEAITAAVAASAAVAITQPYVRAQQELDAKMSEVLNKINSVHAAKRDSLTTKDRERIEDLERQLADLTQKRLDYMEKMQQHHMEWQNKMLVGQSRTCVMQRDHYEPVTVRRPDVPVCVTQVGRPYASMNDLDRDLYPVPRADDRAREAAGRGKLLEEILAQSKDRRDVIMTSPVASSAGRYGLESKPSTPVYARKSPGVSEYVSDKLSKATVGPTPLDGYLRKPTDVIPTSPYPALGDRRRESMETYNITHVEAVLQTLSKNKQCLENNFRTLLKAKNDADVYNIVDCIARESVGAEVARRRRMVDDCIEHLSGEVKALVEDDLNRERLAKENEELGIVEEKKPLKKPRFGGRIQPRVDTGIRRVEPPKDVRIAGKGKENVPAKRAVKPSAKPVAPPVYTDENYLAKVYGKATYQNKRTTVKNPYLHFNNPVSPPNKATRPMVTQEVKAIALKSARTQTSAPGARALPPPGQQPSVSYITVQGQQVPVAIALGPPRQGGTKEAVVIRTGPRELKTDHETKLEVKVLPSVDIDSEAGNTPVPEKTRLERMVHGTRDRRLNDIPETGVDTIGRGLTFPGYHPPTPDAYMGPAYPPGNVQPQYPIPEDSSAREMAEALREKDLLQNKARDWIEQELMARILLERQKLREDRPRDPVPHQVPSVSPQTSVEDETAGALNNRGVQMFVDSGLPVNEGLVKKLIGDVIKDRLRNAMGTNQKPRTKVTSPRKTTSPRRQKSRESSRKDEVSRNGVDASLNVSSINSSPPKIMSPLDANHTARSSMVTESESESTNELAAIWGKKPVLTIEEEDNSVLQYSQKRDDTPVPSGSEVWEYEDDFPQTPGSEHQQTVSQAPSTPSTPGATPGPGQTADPGRRSAEPVRRSADDDVRISMTSREPSLSLSSPRKGRGSRGRTPRPEMDEMAVQTDFPPLPPSPAPSSLSPSSTMVTDTFNESLSEGEWLISHSEGQAPDVDPVRRTALLQYLGDDEPSIAVSVDIPQDEHYQGFLNRSVGEFIRPRMTPDHPPNLLQYLSQIRPPVHPLQRFSRPDVYPSPVHPRLDTQKSLGELVAEGDLLLEQHEQHEYHEYHGTEDDDPLRLSELGRRPEPRPEVDSFPPRPASLQSTPAPSSVKSSDTQGRTDVKSSDTRSRIVIKSSDTQGQIDDVRPEIVAVQPRMIYVRSSYDDDGVDDTMRNVQGTLASSLGQAEIQPRPDTRTPDQMNVDHLRAAGYLTQTLSDSEQTAGQDDRRTVIGQDDAADERRAVIGQDVDDRRAVIGQDADDRRTVIGQDDADDRRAVIGQSIDQGNLSTLRSSFGGTGQFTVTESLEEGEARVLLSSTTDPDPDPDRRAAQERQMVVRMPSAGDQSETETAEDISEISIT